MRQQIISLNERMAAPDGQAPPLVITVSVSPRIGEVMGGVPASNRHDVHYVLLNALPEELRQRVVTAVQALQSQF